MTLDDFKKLFRRNIKVVPGGPSDRTRGLGLIAALDALATELKTLLLSKSTTLAEAQDLLLTPTPALEDGSRYAIASNNWDGLGTASTVYVRALTTSTFEPTGTLLRGGVRSLVTVDVAAGTTAPVGVDAYTKLQSDARYVQLLPAITTQNGSNTYNYDTLDAAAASGTAHYGKLYINKAVPPAQASFSAVGVVSGGGYTLQGLDAARPLQLSASAINNTNFLYAVLTFDTSYNSQFNFTTLNGRIVNGILNDDCKINGATSLEGGTWVSDVLFAKWTKQPDGTFITPDGGTVTDKRGGVNAVSKAYVDAADAQLTAALASKAPLASPALTGTPTAPTAAVGINSTQLATTAYVLTAQKQGELGRLTNAAYYVSYYDQVLKGSSTLNQSLLRQQTEVATNGGGFNVAPAVVYISRLTAQNSVTTTSFSLAFQLAADYQDGTEVVLVSGGRLAINASKRIRYIGAGTLVATDDSGGAGVFLQTGSAQVLEIDSTVRGSAPPSLTLVSFNVVAWTNPLGLAVTVYLQGTTTIPGGALPAGVTVVDQRNTGGTVDLSNYYNKTQSDARYAPVGSGGTPTTGIDYANPVQVSAAMTLAVNKAYYVTGSGYMLTLPDPVANLGAVIFVQIANTATGLYPVSGSNVTVYAGETMSLRATKDGWNRAGGQLLPMVARLETTTNQQDIYSPGGIRAVPLSVRTDLQGPAGLAPTAGGTVPDPGKIVIQRDGRGTFDFGGVIKQLSDVTGDYTMLLERSRAGVGTAYPVVNYFIISPQAATATSTLSTTQAVKAGDVYRLTLTPGSSNSCALAGNYATNVFFLQFTEIV
jgi:hypothetical protein